MAAVDVITEHDYEIERKLARYLAISAAVSYWPFSPVPLSPITAKRIEFGFSGSFNSGGEAGVSAARKSRMEKMHRIVKSRNRVGNEIDDQVGLDVARIKARPTSR